MKLIPLTQGEFAKVDDGMFDFLSLIKWHCHKNGNRKYAASTINNGRNVTMMHDIVVGYADGFIVDHIDGDGLNNQRFNLRHVNKRENSLNSYKKPGNNLYKGVFFIKRYNTWSSGIGVNGKRIHIGTFKSEYHAALAYDVKAREFFGEYARLNFPDISNFDIDKHKIKKLSKNPKSVYRILYGMSHIEISKLLKCRYSKTTEYHKRGVLTHKIKESMCQPT